MMYECLSKLCYRKLALCICVMLDTPSIRGTHARVVRSKLSVLVLYAILLRVTYVKYSRCTSWL